MAGLGERYADTWYAHCDAEEAVMHYALRLFGVSEEDIEAVRWPFSDVAVDCADWEGMSLEIKGARKGLFATLEQCDRAYNEEGFDVIDIQYGDDRRNYRRFYPRATLRRFAALSREYYDCANIAADGWDWGVA